MLDKVISGKIVEVVLKTKAACGGCNACHKKDDNLMWVEVINEIGAKVGDRVEIEIVDREIVKNYFIIYLVPVFALMLGYLLGSSALRLFGLENFAEAFGVVMAFVFTALSFVFIKYYASLKKARNGRGRIIGVI